MTNRIDSIITNNLFLLQRQREGVYGFGGSKPCVLQKFLKFQNFFNTQYVLKIEAVCLALGLCDSNIWRLVSSHNIYKIGGLNIYQGCRFVLVYKYPFRIF